MFLHRFKLFRPNTRFTIRQPLLPVLLVALTVLSGCGRYRRTKQCRALIAQVNPALDDVLTITHGNVEPASVGSYVAAAGRYERLAKQLGPMEFASEEMAQYVAEYVGILNSAARDLKNLAAALEANNAAEADKINRDLERVSGRERSVMGMGYYK